MHLMKAIHPLLGKIVWHPKHSTGSMISLEFGEPTMQVREPKTPSDTSKALSPLIQKKLLSRFVVLKGQYSLLFSECSWVLQLDGSEFAHSESSADLIGRSIEGLQGQKIVEIGCRIEKFLQFEFTFDLGLRILTKSLKSSDLHFDLFDNVANKILSVRGDGMVVFGDSDLEENELVWEFPKDIEIGNSEFTKINVSSSRPVD